MNEKSIVKNRYFLYVTAFFSGMSIMAIELGASRLLAPYFSSSQIVWTVIIGTIMIALALGNVIGGRIADKDPNPDKLYRRMFIAAVWTALIPFLGKYVILAITGLLVLFVKSNLLIWAALASCFVLFVFPLLLLGTVTPSLMKFCVSSLENNGKIMGEIEALGTIGSIIGTFLPTFVTIPTVGTATTFLIFAGALTLICLIYFVSVRRRFIRTVVVLVLIIVCFFVPFKDSFAFWEPNLLYEGESIYNYLQVKEDDKSVILMTNVLFGVQSIMMKDEVLTGFYYEYALAGPLMAGFELADEGLDASDKELLILGLGSGTYAGLVEHYFGNVHIEGVEIDEKITLLAEEYFNLNTDNVDVIVDDGRAYLQTGNTKKYDIILCDAYQDITIPFQMASVEFFELCKEHLKEDGILIVNMNMRSSREGAMNDYLCDTVASVYGDCYTVVIPSITNTLLFTSNGMDVKAALSTNLERLDEKDAIYPLMHFVNDNMRYVEAGELILTDDKAPVELLGMKVIDDIINDNLAYYRKLLKEQGIQGLLGN